MVMSTNDIPRGNTVADVTKKTEPAVPETRHETKTEVKSEARAEAGNLAPAGQSGDPDVQRLLAEREGHMMSIVPDPNLAVQRERAQKAVDEIDDKLADLGYTAK